jgi:nucleoside 2-deoxyribosyltransferase
MKVYLASPLGFAESSRLYLEPVKQVLQSHGLEVWDPWSEPALDGFARAARMRPGPARLEAFQKQNTRVAARNQRQIEVADMVVAILDGVDVDSGTASEIGYAHALGKLIVGLRTDIRRSGENEAVIVNLQVQHWIDASRGSRGKKGRIVTSLDSLDKALQDLVPKGRKRG